MSESLWHYLDRLQQELQRVQQIVLLVDFDGTLVPLQNRPEDCYLSGSMAAVLTQLAEHPRVTAGIISGRELADLKTRIGLPRMVYAGNHGLEIEFGNRTFVQPEAAALVPILHEHAANLQCILHRFPGAWLQNKSFTASVHYRLLDPALVMALEQAVYQEIQQTVLGKAFQVKRGKAVLEIYPKVEWHKGKAVEWLLNNVRGQAASTATIFLGDDSTDEDVFRIIPDEWTVHVGELIGSQAKYQLESPRDVEMFIIWLAETILPTSSSVKTD